MNTTIGTDIHVAAALLQEGEVVAIPTETVYGLAGNALSQSSIENIFHTKGRPLHNPLILHAASVDRLKDFCAEIPPLALAMAEAFWPGPLTMLLPKKAGAVPDILNNGLPDIAVRIPDHPLTLALLQVLEFPLAAPSANPFGYISPTTPLHVMKQLGGKIPYILDGGPCKRGIESTIVRFGGEDVVVLRQGAIPAEAIQEVVANVRLHSQKNSTILAPGMLASHYAPRTKLMLVANVDDALKSMPEGKYGALLFCNPANGLPADHQIILSPNKNSEEAAARLYSALHELDSFGFDLIIAERLPDSGIGAAINDRLTRAAH